jgi:hypothetical protein
MKSSNFEEVGQMRRRSGTSMKRIMKAHALFDIRFVNVNRGVNTLQANGAEDDEEWMYGEDVCNAKSKAENHTEDSGPIVRCVSLLNCPLPTSKIVVSLLNKYPGCRRS